MRAQEEESGIFFFFFKITDNRFKATEKCAYISRAAGKNEGEGLSEAVANITFSHSSIMKKGNLSKSGDSVMTAGTVAAMEMNLPRFKNIHCRASWNGLTQG